MEWEIWNAYISNFRVAIIFYIWVGKRNYAMMSKNLKIKMKNVNPHSSLNVYIKTKVSQLKF